VCVGGASPPQKKGKLVKFTESESMPRLRELVASGMTFPQALDQLGKELRVQYADIISVTPTRKNKK
jgi:uncharacterized protein YoaH (UPF0181 family)